MNVASPEAFSTLGAGPLLQSPGCKHQGMRRRHAVETQAKRFFVSGTVQGVGFRFFVERAAANLGIAGYARNLYDGRVEVYAIGNTRQIESLRNALERGPTMASVERVEEQDAEIQREYAGAFSIERSE